MDLKCLIKLLLEKEIIKRTQKDCTINGNIIMSVFEFEYDEVFQKIYDSDYNRTNVCVTRAHHDKKKFCILNIDHLEKGLIYLGKDMRSFSFPKRKYGLGHFPYKKLTEIINDQTRFRTNNDYDLNENFIHLVDEYLEQKKIKEEFEKKNKVLDFLNQLP